MKTNTKKNPAISEAMEELNKKKCVHDETDYISNKDPLRNIFVPDAVCDDGAYKNEDNGLYFYSYQKDGGINEAIRKRITGAPVKPLYRFSSDNQEGKFGLTVEFKTMRGYTTKANIFYSQLQSNGGAIRSMLADLGLEITDDKSQNGKDRLISYLRACKTDKFKTITTRTGWKKIQNENKYLFILPNAIYGDTKDEFMFDNPSFNLTHIKTKGTLKQWQDNVAKLSLSSSRAVLSICCNFAGPLLKITNAMNFGIHLKGNSTDGKTTALKIGRSVIGYSSELDTWRATKNDLENTAIANNDLTVTLDEIGQSNDLKSIQEIVYSLINGTSKGRMNRQLQSLKKQQWNIVVMSSGETGIREIIEESNKKTRAGTEVRLIELPSDAGCKLGTNEFVPNGFSDIQEYATAIKDNLTKYYGVPFEAFIKSLLELLEDFPEERLKKFINEEVIRFVRKNTKSEESGQIKRIAESFGLVLVAGLMASGGYDNLLVNKEKLKNLGYEDVDSITGWTPEQVREDITRCYKAWREDFGSGRNREDDVLKEEVTKWLVDNDNNFYSLTANFSRQEGEGFKVWGWQEEENGTFYYWIKPSVLKTQLFKGKNPKRFLEKLRDLNILSVKQKSRGFQTVKNIKGNSKKTYLLILKDEDESAGKIDNEAPF